MNESALFSGVKPTVTKLKDGTAVTVAGATRVIGYINADGAAQTCTLNMYFAAAVGGSPDMVIASLGPSQRVMEEGDGIDVGGAGVTLQLSAAPSGPGVWVLTK